MSAIRNMAAVAVAAIGAIAAAGTSLPAGAQNPQTKVNDEPLTGKWSPSEWGPDDSVGAPNRTTPELVLKAVSSSAAGARRSARCIRRTRRHSAREAGS